MSQKCNFQQLRPYTRYEGLKPNNNNYSHESDAEWLISHIKEGPVFNTDGDKFYKVHWIQSSAKMDSWVNEIELQRTASKSLKEYLDKTNKT